MRKVMGWIFVAVVTLILIGQVLWYSVGISTDDETIEVPAGTYVAQILRVDEMYDGPVEARLNARHLSGPAVDIFVLDKENFDLFENEGKWLMGVGGDRPILLGRRVANDNFGPVHSDLEALNFDSRLKTDWIPIGSHNTLYLVLSSRDAERSALVEAVLTVRDD